MTQMIKTDVVVVGAGGAGLVAGATASIIDDSIDVVLLERDERDPCNTVIASNFIPAAATRFQAAAGIEDSPQLMAADIERKNGGRSDPQLTAEICARSAEMIHWLADGLGVEMEFAPELAWVGQTQPRMHAHRTRSGIAIVTRLRELVSSRSNIRYCDRTSARGLITDNAGAVLGVEAEGADGLVHVHAAKTVLTTGGFNANHAMLARYIPEMCDAPNIGARSSTGDGIRWGVEIGAASALMSGYQGRDCIFEDGTRVTPGVITEGGIAVNLSGQRFVNELRDYSELARVYRSQPGEHAVFIWDERIQHMARDVFVMRQAMERGGIIQCASVADIARAFSLPNDVLTQTLERYNHGVRMAQDAFGRAPLTKPLVAPYYCARITGAMAHTQGGLCVDTQCRVLKKDTTPVEHLYAGGNTIAGLSGDGPGGYSSGNGLLVAYVTGMIIGQQVVETLRKSK